MSRKRRRGQRGIGSGGSGASRRTLGGRAGIADDHFYVQRAGAARDGRIHTREVAGGAPAHRLALTGGAERAAGGGEHDGFEQVGLALRVAAGEDDEAARQREIERGVVAEVGQAQPLDVHRAPPSSHILPLAPRRSHSLPHGRAGARLLAILFRRAAREAAFPGRARSDDIFVSKRRQLRSFGLHFYEQTVIEKGPKFMRMTQP